VNAAALNLLAALVLDTGEPWGATATRVQWEDAEAILAEGEPRRHWLGRSRGYSKTTDVAALLLVLLTSLAPGSECVAAAADADQAAILTRRMRGLIMRTPGLAGQFDIQTRRVTFRKTGSFVEVLAADGASAWGLSPAVVVLDEFPFWHDTENARELFDALVTALPKRPGSRLIVMGTAGDPSSWAAKIYEAALADPEAWRVSEPTGPPPWMSPAEVELERKRLLPSTFARLFQNRWQSGEDRLATPAEVAACVGHEGDLAPAPGHVYAMGLDIGLKSDRTALTIAHMERRPEPTVVVDRVFVWQGTLDRPVDLSQVEATIFEAHQSYRGKVVVDPYQAAHLVQRLRRRGVSMVEFTFSSASVGRLALTLFRLLRDARLDLPNDAGLLDELARVKLLEPAPGVYRIDHAHGEHDDRAISLALVAQRLVSRPMGGTATLHVAEGRVPTTRPIAPAATLGEAAAQEVAKARRPRPTVRVGRFTVDREFYTPPGATQRWR